MTVKAPVKFTERDFDSIRVAIQTEIRNQFPEWTDFSTGTFGNILIDLYAHVLDVLDFYLNNQVNECFIGTVRLRRNMIAIGRLVGFRMKTARASSATITISMAASAANDVLIPKGTRVLTPDQTSPVEFRTTADATIPAGEVAIEVEAENAQEKTETFTGNGKANQRFQLASKPYIDATAAVVVAGDAAWTEVEHFLFADADDKVFQVLVDDQDKGEVRFGDGVNGQPPSGTVAVTYKVGGGAAGNVAAETITELQGSFADSAGNPVTLYATNDEAASGGQDRETVAQARVRAPKSFRSLVRTVSREDYETNALAVPGVGRTIAITNNEDDDVPLNTVVLPIVPVGGGLPTQALKDAVLTEVTVTKPNTVTTIVDVVDPLYRVVNVAATVYLDPGAAAATVKAAIEAALAEFFDPLNDDGTANETVTFGKSDGSIEITRSSLIGLIEEVTGVRKVRVDNFVPASDVVLLFREFPQLGTVTLTNGDTGLPL